MLNSIKKQDIYPWSKIVKVLIEFQVSKKKDTASKLMELRQQIRQVVAHSVSSAKLDFCLFHKRLEFRFETKIEFQKQVFDELEHKKTTTL